MFNRILVVKYNNLRDNFIYSSSKYLKIGSCVQISYGSKVVYLSVSAQTSQFEHEYISLNSVYAKILGIEENELVTVSETSNLPSVKRITIAPVNPNEYEILELLSENVQSTLLDQIRVVSTGQKFIIWIGSNINVVVYVENVEPKSPGTLDFLTEVVIKPRTDFLEKNSILNDCGSEKDNFILNFDQLKSLKSESKVNEKFRNFCNFKHNLICRLIPVNKLPFAEKIAEKFTDFNVFISKKSLPQSWISNNSKIICSMKLLSLDLVSEKVIYVKLCIIDDYLGESLIQSAFVSNTILEQFGRQVGCRVILTYTEEKPFVSEITISTKKNYLLNVEEKFKSYLAQNSDDLIILNSDIIINIGDCVKCSLKFSPPEAKFCIVDNDLVRNCNFFVNEGATIPNENINDLSKPVKFLESVLNFQTIIDKISSIYTLGENDWENVLITGRPGTGKSTLLKILADKLNSYPNLIFTKVINCKSVKGKTLDSMLKVLSTAFSELVLYQPSMLFLDDLHLLCEAIKGDEAAPNSVYANRISEMLHTYLSMFSQFNKIGICVTAESTSKLNKNIYSSRGSHLFKNLFSITDLSKADRIQLLKYFFEEYTLQNVNFDYLSVKTEGFVIQDVLDFCNKSVFEAYKDGCDASDVVVSTEHFEKALKNTCILSLQNVNLHSPGSKDFSDIGGLHNVKKILIENLMWPAQYPKIFANAPLRLQSGLLLYGSPGTGKTLLAAAAARHCGLRLISVKGPELLSKYIGASEQAVRDVFGKAESARPCILFFDEFDSLAPRRGHDNTGVTDRVVNQLLTQLDGVESLSGVCVLAATSRPDLLDPALLRPGRLDRQISCPLPCRDDRLEILEILSRKLDLSTDVNLDVIASSTEGFSGADLQSILYTAQLSTVDHLLDNSKESLDIKRTQICQKHLEDALRKTRPSLPEQERRRYETIYSKFQGGTTIDDFKPGSKATLA